MSNQGKGFAAITGASSGIGKIYADRFAKRNFALLLLEKTDNLVDAALAGLDQDETVTLPSLEDASLWADFDRAKIKMFESSQTKRPASRYGLHQGAELALQGV